MTDRPALRRCTHHEVAHFADRVWGREASLSRREQLPRGSAADLLDAEAVDRLLSTQGLRTPFLRVAQDGETFASSRFTRGGGVGALIADQVDDVALARLFADGATLVLQGLHRTHAPVLDFAQQLATDLGHPVQANAYVTPPQSRGFDHHYDVHDVFVLQVTGRKRWLVHPPVHRHPRRDQPWTDRRPDVARAAEEAPELDVVLEPGDVLYLPAGFVHAAEAQGSTSVHLTFGIHVWTRAHLLEHLVASVADTEELREPLPLGTRIGDPAAIAADLFATVDALLTAARRVDVTDVADRLARTADRSRRAEPVGPVAQAEAARGLGPGTPLRWRRHLRADLADVALPGGGRGLRVSTADGAVTLPAAARPGVERLLAGEVLAAAELGDGHDGGMEGTEVARTLLRAALAVPA